MAKRTQINLMRRVVSDEFSVSGSNTAIQS